MAYDPRGSQVLVVDGLTFRWKQEPGSTEVIVWHQLDMGRLTVRVPPGFVAREALVAGVVRDALAHGWDTANHRALNGVPEETRAPGGGGETVAEAYERQTGFEPMVVFEQGDAGELVDDAVAELEAEDVLSWYIEPGACALQVVWVPTFGRPVSLTFFGRRGTVEVDLRATGPDIYMALADGDPAWLQDSVVHALSGRDRPSSEGFRMDDLPARVIARTSAATFAETGEAGPHGSVRTGALAAWRMGMAAFRHQPHARRVLERLHAALQPEEPGLAVDGRTVRVYGRMGWPNGSVVLEAIGDGPWVVDTRDLHRWTDPFADRLLAHADGHPWPVVLVGTGSICSHPTPEAGWHALLRDANQRLAILVATAVDPRWHGSARDLLRDGLDAVGLVPLASCLGPGWVGADRPPDTPCWRYALGPEPSWGPPPDGPALGIGLKDAWIRLPDGSVLVWTG